MHDISTLEGFTVVAADGQFLGVISSKSADRDSMANIAGPYGNAASPTAIFNTTGAYGSKSSPLSPFNPASSNPPKIFSQSGNVAAYLTKNTVYVHRVDPDILRWASTSASAKDAR
ncbi:MAG: hypothetical protein ACLQVD_19635 [Capsulimonadaceae bacterium]